MLLGDCALPAEEHASIVTVRVYNYAKVPRSFLRGAEREAGRIFTAAGLHTIWVDCLGPHIGAQWVSISARPATWTERDCQEPAGGVTVGLRLLGPAAAIRRAGFAEDLAGFATGRDLASIFYRRVEDLAWGADKDENETPLILGNVMAHELGHLLLGTNSHSPSGIMCANWDEDYLRQALRGHQFFSPEQSALMRAAVLRWQTETTP